MRLWDYFWHKLLKRPYKLRKIHDEGNGRNTVVLIHGLASRSEFWLPLIAALDKSKYRVISYDLLGFGMSPKPKYATYSTDQHAEEIVAALNKDIGKDQKIILIGHSMGCIIATNIAFKYPQLVKHLVLYQPPLLVSKGEKRSFYKKFYAYVGKRPPMLMTYYKVLVRIFPKKLTSFESAKTHWEPVEKSIQNTIIAQQTIFQLKKIKVKTDIIYGRMDFVVSKLNAKKIAEINPKIKPHYINQIHDINKRTARYIKDII